MPVDHADRTEGDPTRISPAYVLSTEWELCRGEPATIGGEGQGVGPQGEAELHRPCGQ